jgi:type I restriction enzyme, S subunit
MNKDWSFGILDYAVNRGSSNISLNKIQEEIGDFPVFGAKGFVKNISFFQQEKDYLAIIKDGAGIGRVSKHPSKSSVLATMQYLIPKEGFEIDFIRYFLESLNFEEYRTGSTIPHIYYKDYKNAKFPLVEPLEQKQIVAILDQAFAAIDQAKANIEKNIANAKELFQSKLNEIFSQKGEGWEEKTLGDACSLYQGLAINKKTKYLLVEKSSLPLLRIKDLRNNTHEQYVAESGYPTNALVKENEIIYTRTGNSLGLVFRGRKGILHNNSFKIIPNDSLSNDYLFWWLQHDAFTSRIFELASKAAQPDISHKLFKEELISIPSKEQQVVYYNQIVCLDKSTKELILKYEKKYKSLDELKKSILQKAFAGELTKN